MRLVGILNARLWFKLGVSQKHLPGHWGKPDMTFHNVTVFLDVTPCSLLDRCQY